MRSEGSSDANSFRPRPMVLGATPVAPRPPQSRHNPRQTPPLPQPDAGRVHRETAPPPKTALEWVRYRSPPQYMVWKVGCKPISNSIKSRFDNFRSSP